MILDVLVVDDETPIREWVAYNIDQARDRFRLVGTAKSGTEALALVREKKPHVVISDIVMPGMDGIELLRTVREASPETRVILLTNHADFQFARQAVNYNAFDYLLKSELRSADLLATLEQIRGLLEANRTKPRADGRGYDEALLYAAVLEGGEAAARELTACGFPFSDELEFRVLARRSAGHADGAAAGRPSIAFLGKDIRWILARSEADDDSCERTGGAADEADPVGASERMRGAGNLPAALSQAEHALVFGELGGRNGIIRQPVCEEPRLDRKEIWQEQQRIYELLFSGRIAEGAAALERWYERLQALACGESLWVKDVCEHMGGAIAQAVGHSGAPAPAPRAGTAAWSLQDYRTHALKSLEALAGGAGQRVSKTVSDALQYIHAHFSEDLSLEEVARSVYRSSEYFSRQFKQEVGENFSIYLVTYRLREAKKLLASGKYTVGETAARVGYPNASYFSRIYKKYMGITPEREREQNK